MAADRFGRSIVSVWQTVPEEGGAPLRAWALLDSGEYASAGWEGGGPEAGWFDLIAELRDLRFDVGAADLDAIPMTTREEPATLRSRGDTAFIAESVEDETWCPAGRFCVHLDTGDRSRAGPEGTDFDTAVAWARERTDTVLFRPEGTNHQFSLGTRPVNETPAWPPGTVVRSRPERTPLDGSVTERPWSLRASCAAGRPLAPLPESLRATVVHHSAGADGWTAMIDVVAASAHDALRRLEAALALDGLEDAGPFIRIGYSSDDE